MNLKPGMLCLIIGSKHAPENIGKQVTLVRYFGKDESIVTQDGEFNNLTGSDVWLVEGADLVCTMRDEIGAICYMKKNWTACISNHLMPLTGLEDEFVETQQTKMLNS